MGIDKLLLKADVLGGKIVYKGFERITSQTEATQKKLLQKIDGAQGMDNTTAAILKALGANA